MNQYYQEKEIYYMKSVKRILSVAVAVLLIAMMMIPAVSAAGSNTVNWTCAYPGYTYTVYTVATYKSSTGAFTATPASLQTAVNNAVTANQMATLAETLTTTSGLTEQGTTFTTNARSGSFTLPDGIYFIKCTQEAGTSKGITKQSIVVFPNKNGTTSETIPLADKIDEGQPHVYKDFLINGAEVDTEQTFGTGDTITYILKADVTGTKDNKLKSFIITDRMGTGLNTAVHNVTSVSLKKKDGTTVKENLAKSVVTTGINCPAASTVDGTSTADNTFGVSIADTELAQDSFYGDDYQVVVVFETELTEDAKINTEIPNTDDLVYENGSGLYVVPGETVILKTYQIAAKKVVRFKPAANIMD